EEVLKGTSVVFGPVEASRQSQDSTGVASQQLKHLHFMNRDLVPEVPEHVDDTERLHGPLGLRQRRRDRYSELGDDRNELSLSVVQWLKELVLRNVLDGH